MTLELWNTFATFGTFVVIAATALAALVQLRHLRAGNQINAMLAIGDELGAKPFRDAILLVHQKTPDALRDPAVRAYTIAALRGKISPGADPEHVELLAAERLVGNAYEELGILVKRGIVDRDMFLDRYCWVILRDWKHLEIRTAFAREATGVRALWENFEYLAVLCEDWINEHPSSYPPGVRRMQITNPWPIASAPAT